MELLLMLISRIPLIGPIVDNERAKVKTFLSPEANELRRLLLYMASVHFFFVFVMPAGIVPMLVDAVFTCLAYKSILQLDKIFIMVYWLGVVIVFIIGVTHLFNPIVFRSTYHYFLYVTELSCYWYGAIHLALLFKDHVITQVDIRQANETAKKKKWGGWRIRKGLAAKVTSAFIAVVKEKFFEIL